MYNALDVAQIRVLNPDAKIGWICSCWDLLHPGHVAVLEDAKGQCDVLVVGLHSDPTIDRPHKNKPVMTLDERRKMIHAIKHVDVVVEYDTEADHYSILKGLMPDIRILGDDYIGNYQFTGADLPIKLYYHSRTPGWSTSDFRKRVWSAENNA